MNNLLIPISIHANERTILNDIFGSESPRHNLSVSLDGVDVAFKGIVQKHGMTTEDIIITVLLNISTGIPIGLVSSWIFEKLSKKGSYPVEIGSDPVIKTSENEIIKAVEVSLSVTLSQKIVNKNTFNND